MTDPKRLLDEGSEASPLLRELLASARRADEPSPSQVASVAAGLGPLLGPVVPPPVVPPPVVAPPVVATASAGHAALAAKLGAVLVALGVVGGGVWYVQPHRETARPQAGRVATVDAGMAVSPEVIDAPEMVDAPAVIDAPAMGNAPDAATIDAPEVVEPAKPAPHRAPRPPRDDAAEGKLVIAAEDALVRDDAAAALALTRQHGAQFPAGAHAEERDRIAIEALVRLGRADRAHAAADRFFTRYPRSIYRARLESLLR